MPMEFKKRCNKQESGRRRWPCPNCIRWVKVAKSYPVAYGRRQHLLSSRGCYNGFQRMAWFLLTTLPHKSCPVLWQPLTVSFQSSLMRTVWNQQSLLPSHIRWGMALSVPHNCRNSVKMYVVSYVASDHTEIWDLIFAIQSSIFTISPTTWKPVTIASEAGSVRWFAELTDGGGEGGEVCPLTLRNWCKAFVLPSSVITIFWFQPLIDSLAYAVCVWAVS